MNNNMWVIIYLVWLALFFVGLLGKRFKNETLGQSIYYDFFSILGYSSLWQYLVALISPWGWLTIIFWIPFVGFSKLVGCWYPDCEARFDRR